MNQYEITLIHICLSALLFVIINIIGRHAVSLGYIQLSILVKSDEAPAFNFILKTFSPIVYIIIISSICYGIGMDSIVNNIWKISFYYYLLRVIFNLSMDRSSLINWKIQFIQWLICIPLSYFIYLKLILNKTNLLPDYTSINNQLWIIIILFLYSVFNNIKTSSESTRRRKHKYLSNKYREFYDKYSEEVNKILSDNKLKMIFFSIMIYENFARPKFIRFFENMTPNKFSITRGIMQIESNKKLSDLESVRISAKKINDDYNKSIEEIEHEYKGDIRHLDHIRNIIESRAIRKTVSLYNKDDDYISEVIDILNEIEKIDPLS